jgi:hypothetical protein
MNAWKNFWDRVMAGTRQGAIVGGAIGAVAGVAIQAVYIVVRGWIPDAATTIAVALNGIEVFALSGACFGIAIGGPIGGVARAILGRSG